MNLQPCLAVKLGPLEPLDGCHKFQFHDTSPDGAVALMIAKTGQSWVPVRCAGPKMRGSCDAKGGAHFCKIRPVRVIERGDGRGGGAAPDCVPRIV